MTTRNPAPKKFSIPIGPQHPALKEPGHFELNIEGEVVTGGAVRLGYAHRGIEKAAESRSYTQNLYMMERVCGICSHIHAMAFAMAAEQLAGVTVTPRAQAIRTLVAEMERIHSHMLWLGVAAHQAGFDTLFMYSWRDRETIMDCLEQLAGNRVNYSVNLLGGVKYDVTPEIAESIRGGVTFLEERMQHYLNVVTGDPVFLQRTRGIGTMDRATAIRLGVIGPTARASGLARDLRADAPYAAYAEHRINVITHVTGDLEARFIVRLRELLESIRLIRELLDTLPEGDLLTRMPRRIPAGEAIVRVEAPRGELFYFIQGNGTDIPARVKIRTPSIANIASVLKIAVGSQLADVPMILAGVDPCFSCNDRLVTLHTADDRSTWDWEDLRRYGIDYYGRRS